MFFSKSSLFSLTTSLSLFFLTLFTGAGTILFKISKIFFCESNADSKVIFLYLKEFSKKTSNYFVIFLSSIISGAIACNQSLGTILTYELCEELEEKQNMAIILENTIVLLAGLIPWNIAMAVPLKTIDIGLMSGLFAFYLYFLPLWNLFLGIIKEKRKIIR